MSFRPTVLPAWLLAASVALLAACRESVPTEAPSLSATGSGPTVTAAVPDSASQDTTLDVHVLGSGFDRGSKAEWAQSGVVSSDVTTNSTQYVSTKELVANITIALAASTGRYDILVTTSKGKKGTGTELFTINPKGGPPKSVASVEVSPTQATMVEGSTLLLTATTLDNAGKTLTGRTITWSTDNAAAATVSSVGLVTAVAPGGATISATSEGVSGTAAITTVATIHGTLVFTAVRSGSHHVCGILTAGSVRCWGRNYDTQLGDGTNSDQPTPVAVLGGVTFAAVSPGFSATCGIATGGGGYCWGTNVAGLFGDGSQGNSPTPVPAANGLTLTTLSEGDQHSCGLTAGGKPYCWGWNHYGELGSGSKTDSPVPVAVRGGLTLAAINTSGLADHTCGLTSSGAAYCWGINGSGQLGATTGSPCSMPLNKKIAVACSLTPVGVTRRISYATISAGSGHTCGVTAGGSAYCWGDNAYGELGDGTTTGGPTPVAVADGLSFTTVSAGLRFSCGLTTEGAAYCWGQNTYGQLGNQTTTGSLTPVPVSGGLTFATIGAGAYHVCGLTTGGVAYCWGRNLHGQLGNGTWTNTSTPTRVAGQP